MMQGGRPGRSGIRLRAVRNSLVEHRHCIEQKDGAQHNQETRNMIRIIAFLLVDFSLPTPAWPTWINMSNLATTGEDVLCDQEVM